MIESRVRVIVLALAGIALSGCASIAPPSTPDRVLVTTTTTVFADIVARVGGDRVEARSIVPSNGDVHTFQARPSTFRDIAASRLVVMNGLGLDDWLRRIVGNVAPSTPVLTLADSTPRADLIVGAEPASENPHLWLDPTLGARYVSAIEDALAGIDPSHAAEYRTNGAAYRERLVALDRWIRAGFASIPAERRRVVTFHDAFPYFARRYGLEIVGVAVPAPGQDPSAAETSRLIEAIRGAGVRAIFSERQFPPRLVESIASETGARVVANLYDDALGDPPVDSYEALVRWDADRIEEALR